APDANVRIELAYLQDTLAYRTPFLSTSGERKKSSMLHRICGVGTPDHHMPVTMSTSDRKPNTVAETNDRTR
ncbi:hypothetical protein ACWCSH_41285, partial [Streptosporangium sp. NPDC001682]